jgi:baculoviral IAP repeat-containing protein 6
MNGKRTYAQVVAAPAPQDNAVTRRKWHRENCVKGVPDHLIREGHAFKEYAELLAELPPSIGRMRKLLGQVSSLTTDLPEGIYVRHGESRLDVLKILISGPAGTPYENGLFEFDMFCGHEFPSRPPKMIFRTTGGGQVYFNPNLYPSGKSKYIHG